MQKGFVDVIKVKDLEMGRLVWIIQEGGAYQITLVLESREHFPAVFRAPERDGSMRRSQLLLALKTEKGMR